MRHLDLNGLSRLWSKITTKLSTKSDIGHTHTLEEVDNTSNYVKMTPAERTKLSGIASGANAYTLPAAGSSLGGVKTGGDVTISDGVITVNDDSHNHTIANVDGLQSALDSKANAHDHPYLSSNTKYALADSVGGAAMKMKVTRVTENITTVAAKLPNQTEVVYFCGSDGLSLGCPKTYCIINIKKGDNYRTIMDCYDLNTGDHYINGCMHADGNDDVWTGWVLQPNQASLDAKVPTSRTVNGKALSANITLSASDVGADASGAADTALSNAKSYTDTKIANLINSAPTTLDTLGEIATAMEENSDVVEALEAAVGTKANTSELTSHTSNKSNPHNVTLNQLGVTATAEEVNVLNGMTATTAELNYMDGVTSNVQTQLDGKATIDHTHSSYENQNAFSYVTVGNTTIAADTTTDTVTLVAGDNITITVDASNKVTIAAGGTTYSVATTSEDGLMSAADKTKLDNLESKYFTKTQVQMEITKALNASKYGFSESEEDMDDLFFSYSYL